MFLFLSKLLPLFLYPLGLSCLLLIVALVRVWKHPRQAAISIALALTLLLVGGNTWVANAGVRSLEWRNIPAAELPTAEAIVVLGGGIKPQVPPRPWVDVAEAGDRVLYGAQLYLQGKAPVVIMSGGRIDWKDGGPPESSDMAKIAVALGVPASAILEDPTSLNTYQNAVNVREILETAGIQRVLLVTSAIHMPRSLAIFRKQGIEAIAAPTDFLVTQGSAEETQRTVQGTLLSLIPDAKSLDQLTSALKEYIGFGVYRLRGWL